METIDPRIDAIYVDLELSRAWSGTVPGQRGRLIEVDRMQSFYVKLDGEPVGSVAAETV